MKELISFPGLGLEFEINRVAFSPFGVNIYWYGICFALAFLCGVTYFHLRARTCGFHSYDGLDVLLWAVIGGVVGARAYFVIFQWDAMYRDNPLKIFAFREGGLALYGGVIGAIVAGAIAARLKKLPLFPLLDAGFPAMLLAQAIGRWGNFFNIEAFGGNTTLPWGMTSPSITNYLAVHMNQLEAMGMTIDPAVPVHPTFFYESAWNLLGFLVLAFVLTPRRKYDGQVFLGYVAWYGLGRFFVEGLRTDSLTVGAARVSQDLALLSCIASLVLMVVFYYLNKREAKPSWLGLYVQTSESQERIVQVERQLEVEKQAAQDRKHGKHQPAALEAAQELVQAADEVAQEVEEAAREPEEAPEEPSPETEAEAPRTAEEDSHGTAD